MQIGSTLLAQAAGVPTIPWSGSDVRLDMAACQGGQVPDDLYRSACVHSVDDALAACARIGYPVMLKASWGGGGKGIRKVRGQIHTAQHMAHAAALAALAAAGPSSRLMKPVSLSYFVRDGC